MTATEVRLVRREFNISQNALAREAGCSQALISRMESEDMEPSEDMLRRLSSALHRIVARQRDAKARVYFGDAVIDQINAAAAAFGEP